MTQGSAVVIGSGPNGLSAAIVLAQAGMDVEVREAADAIGGGTRSAEITLPGFLHDLGSAVHPLAVSSPFFSTLPLEQHGLAWIRSPAAAAHPMEDGTAVMLERDIGETVSQFGIDAAAHRKLFEPLVERWHTLVKEVFRPPGLPRHPVLLARFGIRAMQPARGLAKAWFREERARALFAGFAAHSVLKLDAPLSAAFGLIMCASAHAVGWPIPRGGAQSIANALAGILKSLGGRITTNARVEALEDLGKRDLILCDVTPKQFIALAGTRLSHPFRELLARYRYSPGIYKMDWALSEPIPWRAKECFRAATLHLGGTLDEIAASEAAAWDGDTPRNPYVLLAQPSLFDPTRAPKGQHTAWAYCHVPNGWRKPVTEQIEAQIERYAPGFRECILAKAVHTPQQMQRLNENLIGGDLTGGAFTVKQFALRPTWRQYRTPLQGVYLCSSSTPPGASVHGLCGYYAAQWALKDLMKRRR